MSKSLLYDRIVHIFDEFIQAIIYLIVSYLVVFLNAVDKNSRGIV